MNPLFFANIGKTTSDVVGSKDVIPGFDPFTDRSTSGGVDFGNALGSIGSFTGGLERVSNDTGYGNGQPIDFSTGRGGSGGSGPVADPAQIGLYDQAIGLTQSNLDRLGNQLKTAFSNIQDQYGIGVNQLDSAKQRGQQSYNQQSTQNQQNLRTDKNLIADQASQGLRGLMRLIGAYGAGGSSDARYVAPQAVAQVATQQRQGAGQNFSQNQQNLDTNWNNYQEQDRQERDKLTDWRTQQRNAAEAQSQTNRQSLLQKLAELQGAKAQYTGGNFAQAAQPYYDQAIALNPQIDALARFNPRYSGKTPTYEQQSLDSYDVTGQAPGTSQSALQNSNSPFLSLLLGGQEERRRY